MTDKVDAFFEAMERVSQDAAPSRSIALATVDPAYVSGAAKVTFDGETTLSARTYPILAPVAAGGRVVMLRAGSTWLVLGQVGGGPGGGGGGGTMTKAQIDALGVDAGTLDGFDSTAFLRTKAQVDALAVDAGTLDGYDSTAFARLSRVLDARHQVSGGGVIKWDGTTFSWSAYLRLMPALGPQSHGYISAGSVNMGTAWSIAFWRPSEGNMRPGSSGQSLSAAAITVQSYADYSPQEFDIILAVHNGDDGMLYLADGRVFDKWRTPTFQNSWVEYSSSYPPRYKKTADGMVVMKGLIKNGASTITNLPAGYRPLEYQYFMGQGWSSGTSYAPAHFYLSPAGDLIFAAGPTAQVALVQISYFAEQ